MSKINRTVRARINKMLIERIKNKHEFDMIEIYHYRTVSDFNHSFLSYKDIKSLKETHSNLMDKLSNGLTVVLVRNQEQPNQGLCSVTFCSEKEHFDKRKGLEIALRRLDNYLSKPNDNSWDYNENNYMSLTNLPSNKDKLVDVVSKHLNQHPFFIKKGYKVFNPTQVLKY